MNRSRIVPVTLTVVLSAIVGGAVAMSAQETPGNNPFVQIMTKLDNISDILTAEPPPPALVTLYTPAVRVSDRVSATCHAANVGTEHLEIRVRFVDFLAHSPAFIVLQVPPGESHGMSWGGSPSFLRCEFTFEGDPKFVRASLLWEDESGNAGSSLDAR